MNRRVYLVVALSLILGWMGVPFSIKQPAFSDVRLILTIVNAGILQVLAVTVGLIRSNIDNANQMARDGMKQQVGLQERLKKWWQTRVDIWTGKRCPRCIEDKHLSPVRTKTDNRKRERSRICNNPAKCRGYEFPVASAG